MGPTASALRAQTLCSDHHGLRAAARDLLEPHPLRISHGLLRVPKLTAIGHELDDERSKAARFFSWKTRSLCALRFARFLSVDGFKFTLLTVPATLRQAHTCRRGWRCTVTRSRSLHISGRSGGRWDRDDLT